MAQVETEQATGRAIDRVGNVILGAVIHSGR
jgi:hypothetical protein